MRAVSRIREERWPTGPRRDRVFPHLDTEVMTLADEPPLTVELAEGRKLAFSLRGHPDGAPCVWLHGSPSGRLEGLLLERFGRDRGYRFLVPDRPGHGGSDPAPGWTMLGFAEDVLRAADALGLERFSVAGGSGGGPFVLALAATAPDRLNRAVALACAGAFDLEALRARAGWVDRLAAWAARRPARLEAYFRAVALLARLPEATSRAVGRLLAPGGDPELLLLLHRTLRESLRMGIQGVVEDTLVLHRPWGFELESIRAPVTLVNGTRDGFVPVAYGRALAERIPDARWIVAPGDDHYRTIFDLERLDSLLGGA